MHPIRVVTKIELKDYISLIYRLTYRRPFILIMSISGCIVMLSSIMSIIALYSGILSEHEFRYSELIYGLVLTVGIPFLTYLSARKGFKSNERLHEQITYEFTEESVKVTGESFSSEFTWAKTNRVKELKEWILIYQNKIIAHIIPKKSFSPEELNTFKALVADLPTVKSKLLK